MLSMLFAAALAEPPLYLPLERVIAESDLVIVGTPQRVYFEDLKTGESLQSNTHAEYWMDYRIDEVLYGDSPVELGENVRITFVPGACKKVDFTIERDGKHFVEWTGTEGRELDPRTWHPNEPRLLALTVQDGAVRHEGYWVTPKPASNKKIRREWERLIGEKRD